jgi:hypothetical protein
MQNLLLHQLLNKRSQSFVLLGILTRTFKGWPWRPASFSYGVSRRRVENRISAVVVNAVSIARRNEARAPVSPSRVDLATL